MANEWYLTDVPRVMAAADTVYARLAEKHPEVTRESLTAQRIVSFRNWDDSLRFYEGRFDAAIRQLGCFYMPKNVTPGPAFIFPMRSADNTYPRAQTKPLDGSLLESEGMKYRYIGDKEKYIGPNWLGNDPLTIQTIIAKQSLICVEGPFDLLAMRLACPDYPSMTPLTKRLGKHHIAYLRILGVKRLLLMYDNEDAGEESMQQQARQIHSMQVIPCECPRKDPSEALEKWEWAKELSMRTRQFFGY